MNEDHLQKVRERAHALWEQAGRPHGQDAEHWAQAEREIAAEGDTRPSAAAAESTGRRGRKPSSSADQTAADAPKAKRGRPAKSAAETSTGAPKATRGRKPKALSDAGAETVQVARGRRSKAPSEGAAVADEENAPDPAPSPMRTVVAEGSDTAE